MYDFDQNIDMDAVYQEYANLVYRFLYSYTHDAEWSQELMQETFLRAVTSISRYDGSCKLSVWLCQIAKHILYQELRKKNRMQTVELMDHIPELEKEVVLYRISGELSFREIGEILGKTENRSRTVFYRAKQKTKKELDAYE